MTSRSVVAGNWKMHHGPSEARDFFARLVELAGDSAPELLIFPPALSLVPSREVAPPWVSLGVQNIFWEPKGAFTGELSAAMAADAGATHVLVGHSERRHVFGETDRDVARKVAAALETGLVPVICVGETLEERRAGRVDQVIVQQLDAVLPTLSGCEDAAFMIAYEPVWAIGTGETATPADAASAHAILRRRMTSELDIERGRSAPILYGGSVKPQNAGELMATQNVGGVLVGGASLEPASLLAIARES